MRHRDWNQENLAIVIHVTLPVYQLALVYTINCSLNGYLDFSGSINSPAEPAAVHTINEVRSPPVVVMRFAFDPAAARVLAVPGLTAAAAAPGTN